MLTEFLFLRRMLTPIYMQIIFWVLLAIIWLSAFGVGITIMWGGGVMILLGPIAFVVIGVLYSVILRIGCELTVVVFKIYDELVAFHGTVRGGPSAAPPAAAAPPAPAV